MKTRTRIACWNLQILGLSEVRRNGFGEQRTPKGVTLLNSDKENEDDTLEYGVGFLFSDVAKRLLDWKPISDRIITARFYTKAIYRSTRRDKRVWADSIADGVQRVADTGNLKEMYKVTNLLAGKRSAKKRPLKNKESKLIVTSEGQLRRWQEHFQEIFLVPGELSDTTIEECLPLQSLDIDCSPPMKEMKKFDAGIRGEVNCNPPLRGLLIPAKAAQSGVPRPGQEQMET
ncbi:hypothetical protein ACJJTC_007390 [Scirpophaga incertulas]